MNNLNNINNYKTAIFAGGCFWCMVSPFHILDGVIEVISGYTGGNLSAPSYEEVKSQNTGHVEAVKILYDESILSYEKLLEAFWRQIDPTDDDGQFQDRGSSYRAAIFYLDENQRLTAEKSKKALMASKRFPKPIVTPILPGREFYSAEEYHQNFYKTHQEEYKKDRAMSGRDEFINKYWGEDYYLIFE